MQEMHDTSFPQEFEMDFEKSQSEHLHSGDSQQAPLKPFKDRFWAHPWFV